MRGACEVSYTNVTSYSHDALTGQLLLVEFPEVDTVVPTVEFTYTDRGQVETKTDPNGTLTEFHYDTDTENLEYTVVDSGLSGLNLTTLYGYNAVGDITSVTDPRGHETTYEFDLERRRTNKTASAPFSFITEWSYDDNGNVTEIRRQTGDVMDPWQTATMTYEADNKLMTLSDPLGHTREFTYDSARRIWKTEDEVGRIMEFGYDAAGRVSTVRDADNNLAITRDYSENGKLTSLTDARSKVTTYEYDGFDRPVVTGFADSTTEEVTSYDDNGNVLTFVTRNGDEIVMTYDELNRLRTKAPDGQATVTFEYDPSGRLKSVRPILYVVAQEERI